MKNQHSIVRSGVLILIVLIAAVTRLIPDVFIVKASCAILLFSAAYFSNKYLAILLPLVLIWASDLVIINVLNPPLSRFAFTDRHFNWNQVAYVAVSIVGFLLLKKVTVKSFILAVLVSAIVYHTLILFSLWINSTFFDHNLKGYVDFYLGTWTWLRNEVIANFLYCGAMFGAFEALKCKFPNKLT